MASSPAIRSALNAELKELNDWAKLSASTDFPQQGTAPSDEEIVRRAYAAFNDRQIDAGVALLEADPHVEIDAISQTRDGRIEAQVRQTMRRADRRIRRMEVRR